MRIRHLFFPDTGWFQTKLDISKAVKEVVEIFEACDYSAVPLNVRKSVKCGYSGLSIGFEIFKIVFMALLFVLNSILNS